MVSSTRKAAQTWRRIMWRFIVAVSLVGAEAFISSPRLSERRGLGATSSRTSCGRPVRSRPQMGTDFEDEAAREKLRAMLNRQFGIGDYLLRDPALLEAVLPSVESSRPDEWCSPSDSVQTGTVLLADPKAFVEGKDRKFLVKFGLAMPLPGGDQLPPDRAADLLPVVLVIDRGPQGALGLMLNRRSGILMGDLGEDFKAFMIQPLWQGGTQGETALSFIHTYQEVEGCRVLMEEEGVYFGGKMESASKLVTDGPGSGFNFRFFVQCTLWGPGELEAEVEKGMWRPAKASKMALLRMRDRKGPDVAKPMWSDLSQLAGGEYLQVMEDFYRR